MLTKQDLCNAAACSRCKILDRLGRILRLGFEFLHFALPSHALSGRYCLFHSDCALWEWLSLCLIIDLGYNLKLIFRL